MRSLTIMLAMLLFLGMEVAFAQRTITGQVTGADDGAPIPGASVRVKGASGLGTMTDPDGNYSLQVPDEFNTLIVTFVGMQAAEVAISGSVVNVALASEDVMVGDIVITALGISREKKEVTYQTQKVGQEDLVVSAPTRVTSALTGKVAGLQINIQDNGVNPSSQVLLRGLRSISGDNSALIVIDGAIASSGALDDLNPNDIESVNVLKGATAAALYGSNASNGALLITTKSGTKGEKLTVGISSSYTLDKVAYMPKFQTKYGTGWEGAYDAIENTNWGPRFDGQLRQIGPTFPDGYQVGTQMVPYSPVKDNLLAFFETGKTLSNTVYLSGSNESSKFYLSLGDQRSTGIVPDDEYRRNTIRVNASKKVGKATLSVNTSYFTDETDVVGSTIGHQDRPLYWFILNTAANIPLSTYKDWSNPASYGYADNYFNGYYQNPYWAVGTNRNNDKSNRFLGNFAVNYDFADWISFVARASANNTWGYGKNWRANQKYSATLKSAMDEVSSFVEDTEYQISNYNMDALVNINRDLNESLNLKVVLGASNSDYNYRWSEMRAENLSIPGFYDISNGTGSIVPDLVEQKERSYGYYGDITLGIKKYLFLNFTGRNDWTSTLADGNNSYFYPAFGLSYVITESLPALQDNSFLSYAKFTASHSTVYNDLQPYQINERYFQATGFPLGTSNGFFLSAQSVDGEIKKEQVSTTEIGLNLSFFESKISIDASYFTSKITDLITSTTPSVASGSTSFLTNIGELESKGFELLLTGNIINAGGFKWDLSVNFSNPETIVREIGDGLNEIAINTTGQYGVYAVVDMPYPQMKANVYKRDPQGRIVVDGVSGIPIQAEGLANLGKTTPDYILGGGSTMAFKGITFNVTFDYRTGHVYYEQGSDNMEFTGRSLASVSANRQDFVIPNSVIETSTGVYTPNTNIQVQGGRQSYWTDAYNDVKSNYVKDATALKIRELSLSYTLPKKFISGLNVQNLTLGFVARNLMTWLPAENMFSDPEFNNSFTNSNVIGVGGYLQSPPTRSFGFNLNIEF